MKLIAVAVAALTLAGCSPGAQNLEDAPVKDPDSAVVWTNISGHPNIVQICVDGVAFATTRTDIPILRVPEWDKGCR